MSQVTRTVNVCEVCHHEWIPKPGVVYTHCTSGKCRSRKWNKDAHPAQPLAASRERAITATGSHHEAVHRRSRTHRCRFVRVAGKVVLA